MAETEYTTFHSNQPPTLLTRVLQGAGVGAILIGLTLAALGSPKPDNLAWLIVPLLIVPGAGGLGGLVFYFTEPLRQKGGSRKFIANTVSFTGYLLLVGLALILGMQGPG